MGIEPASKLSVLEYSPFDNNLKVQIEGRSSPVVIGPRVTNQVFVDLIS
jgi:hypothetical protein